MAGDAGADRSETSAPNAPMDAQAEIADASIDHSTGSGPDGSAETSADAGSADAGDGERFVADPNPCGARGPYLGTRPPLPGQSSVLLDVGHGSAIKVLRHAGSRVLSRDDAGHWVLWDEKTGARMLTGDSPLLRVEPCVSTEQCGPVYGPLELRGATLAAATTIGTIELRDRDTGSSQGTVTTADESVGLSTDGSYLWGASSTQLQFWSRSGAPLGVRNGDYRNAKIFAGPVEVRVGAGPAGPNVIEVVTASTGASTTTATFSGTFHSWFLDGESFFSNTGNSVWIYPKAAGAQKGLFGLATIDGLGGQGLTFWNRSSLGELSLYSVSGGSTPIATYALRSNLASVFPSGTKIGILPYGDAYLRVLDISGASPIETQTDVPVPNLAIFSASDDGAWSFGNAMGVVLAHDSQGTRTLACGAVLSIAGADDGTVTVATESSKLVVASVSAGGSLKGSIRFASSHLELSADGKVLAAAPNATGGQFQPENLLKVFALPSGGELYTGPGGTLEIGISLARGGTRLAQIDRTAQWDFARKVTDVTGSIIDYSDMVHFVDPYGMRVSPMRIHLTPDGRLIAFSDGAPSHSVSTRIFMGRALVAAVPGAALGWIDNARLIVQVYAPDNQGVETYVRSDIYDSSGALQGASPIPELLEHFDTYLGSLHPAMVPVSASQIYAASRNAIYDVTSGAAVWTGAVQASVMGAVAGSFVVTRRGELVVMEPR